MGQLQVGDKFTVVAKSLKNALARIDLAAVRFVHHHRQPYLTPAVRIFEAAFSPEVLLPVGGVGGSALAALGYRRREFRLAFSGSILLTEALGAGALTKTLEMLARRPRPPSCLQLVPEEGYGLPSSHAAATVTAGAAVWYLFSLRYEEGWGGSWRVKYSVGSAGTMLALLVGLGRIYTGAHYPSDVLAGWALGVVWAMASLTAAEALRRWHDTS